jgi:hypothetical protein
MQFVSHYVKQLYVSGSARSPDIVRNQDVNYSVNDRRVSILQERELYTEFGF